MEVEAGAQEKHSGLRCHSSGGRRVDVNVAIELGYLCSVCWWICSWERRERKTLSFFQNGDVSIDFFLKFSSKQHRFRQTKLFEPNRWKPRNQWFKADSPVFNRFYWFSIDFLTSQCWGLNNPEKWLVSSPTGQSRPIFITMILTLYSFHVCIKLLMM